ncbi:MAG: rubredoxin, partial [Deltaproteobacteria bacterium]|nr:rubredoxin [Deltaproteobacteria bacterium]
MAVYICEVCEFIYDEEKEGVKWANLPDTWLCPVCGSRKTLFKRVEETPIEPDASAQEDPQHKPLSVEGAVEHSPVTTVSDLMIETMVNWGVRYVFGMVGHSNLGLADAIRKHCERGHLHYIGVRHEGAASFAASAYGKLTGRPAACLAIAGPGATNLLTGLWDAKLDRVPILALTGQVDLQFIGPGAFQELDLASAFKAVSCWSQTVLE